MSRNFRLRYAALIMLFAIAGTPASARAQSAFEDPGARGKAGGGGGDFKPVADKVDAGEVALGATAQVVVLFRNDDGKPLKTGAINLYPSSNVSATIGENQCVPNPIAPGEVCAISLAVKGLQSGNYRIEMLMRHEGRTKLLTATINGRVAASSSDQTKDLISEIEVIPNKIDFGDLQESRSQVKAVVLRNKTSKPITVQEIAVEAGNQSGYSVTSNCKELQTGAACVASVTWTPAQRGPSTGTLIVRHSGATEINTIELTGEYDPEEAEMAEIFPQAVPGKGLLISSLEEVDFGSGISESSSIAVSLVNAGDVPLTLTGVRMANAENGVRAEKTGCLPGTVLSPLEACPLTLTWEPVREGNIVDDVQVAHTGARGVLILPLRGNAARAINKDRKAIMLSGDPGMDAVMSNIRPLSLSDIEEDGDVVMQSGESAVVSKPETSSAAPAVPADEESEVETPKPAKASRQKIAARSTAAPVAAPEEDVDDYTRLQRRMAQIDVRGALDGYTISSYSPRRAIISGPGGSRVVFDGEQAVIGGVLWEITMRPSAIEFRSGEQKVLLLFDKSLSSVNLTETQSVIGSSPAPATATATSMTP